MVASNNDKPTRPTVWSNAFNLSDILNFLCENRTGDNFATVCLLKLFCKRPYEESEYFTITCYESEFHTSDSLSSIHVVYHGMDLLSNFTTVRVLVFATVLCLRLHNLRFERSVVLKQHPMSPVFGLFNSE